MKILKVLLPVLVLPTLVLAQDAAAPITVPDDIHVWLNLSLAMIFNVVVGALRALNLITDANKKFVGGYLAALGGAVGVIYAVTSGVTDTVQFITLAAGGALAGVTSVGLHSTAKNMKEGFALLRAKK